MFLHRTVILFMGGGGVCPSMHHRLNDRVTGGRVSLKGSLTRGSMSMGVSVQGVSLQGVSVRETPVR